MRCKFSCNVARKTTILFFFFFGGGGGGGGVTRCSLRNVLKVELDCTTEKLTFFFKTLYATCMGQQGLVSISSSN